MEKKTQRNCTTHGGWAPLLISARGLHEPLPRICYGTVFTEYVLNLEKYYQGIDRPLRRCHASAMVGPLLLVSLAIERRREKMERGEDRISNLPNEILQSILCLMPLKYAIRTSTLSKRWIHLWQFNLVSSSSLQIDFSDNQSPEQFVATLDRYLQLHGNRNLDKFGIFFSLFEKFFPKFENWVRTVLAKRVKELDIDLSQGVLNYNRVTYMDDRMPFVMTNSLFNCNSLTHLSLSMCNFSEPFDSTNLVGLNSLSLDHVNLTDGMLTNILENCVSLESISLKRCDSLEVVEFVGDELKLQKLFMVDCRGVDGMEISAPKLESFVYHGSMLFDHDFSDVSKVTDAYFCSGLDDHDENFLEILSEFSHLKVLTICSSSLFHVLVEDLYDDEDDFPMELRNLLELQLVVDLTSEEHLNGIFSFFHLCPLPCLEKLFIQFPSNLDQQYDISDLEPLDVVFQNLKWIKITNYDGSPHELTLVKYLLEVATVLESIFLVMNQCDISKNSLSLRTVQQQLSILPKASKDAQIVICGPLDRDCTMNPTHTTFYHQDKY
ncbi:F-box/FBD/LRR-repeat protein [Carex littledalei]|uniref:F-box/FBD/LRR-repeat protein n=1 Tax=Carex littledalei TaxID=544730 RepID=A0A833R420_9POAL|nr:F-box/FBD/LRR-repeat protein [Carex littledalei]